ncbi:hypothetical protein DFJ74DRAFT_674906 [Hyaloraphidium curvatum]|nr:hypothetical protein DFJ74DRAFT_674906 [Hyaloraphidium curvatum]
MRALRFLHLLAFVAVLLALLARPSDAESLFDKIKGTALKNFFSKKGLPPIQNQVEVAMEQMKKFKDETSKNIKEINEQLAALIEKVKAKAVKAGGGSEEGAGDEEEGGEGGGDDDEERR